MREILIILSSAYIIICGYSNLVYEAYLFGIYSVRIIPSFIFPPREKDPFTPEFENSKDFNQWFYKNENKIYSKTNLLKMRKVSENFYYKNDGKSKNRFLIFLNN